MRKESIAGETWSYLYDAIAEQMAHFAGTQLRQGWSYQFDPLRPQRRVGRTDLVVERPGWAWGYNGRGEITSAQRI